MAQHIETISVDKLRLWTENPRDPMDPDATDYDVISRAIENRSGNWNLDKMLREIGPTYFLNELPTVVLNGAGSYTVYDGNRRVAVFKCLAHPELYAQLTMHLTIFAATTEALTDYSALPCNVCDRETALNIVERTHKSSKKWGALQYEQFEHLHRGQPKGPLMIFDEATGGLVSETKEMNQEYVEHRLLTERNLESVGLGIENEKLMTSLSDEQALEVAEDIAQVTKNKLSSARKNPGNLIAALRELNGERYTEPSSYVKDKAHPLRQAITPEPPTKSAKEESRPELKEPISNIQSKYGPKIRKRPYKGAGQIELFGGLALRPRGTRSNEIYHAIDFIFSKYKAKPDKLAYLLPVLGFSMRLLLEMVAREYYESLGEVADENCLKTFIKEVCKPLLKKRDQFLLNSMAIEDTWINGPRLEATLGKYAHGAMDVQPATLVSCSKVIAVVIQEAWSI